MSLNELMAYDMELQKSFLGMLRALGRLSAMAARSWSDAMIVGGGRYGMLC